MSKPRSIESFQDHINNKVAMCCTSWLVLRRSTLAGQEYIITPNRCSSNFCPICRHYNIHKLRRTLIATMSYDRWRLATLTFKHTPSAIEEALTSSSLMFKRTLNKIRKKTRRLKYIRTIELHKSHMIHLHVVFNRYIPVDLLRTTWQAQGGGIVDIRANRKCPTCFKSLPCSHTDARRPPDYKAAARYLTDELEKKQQDPHNLGYLLWKHRIRTVTTSRNINLSKSTTPVQFVGIYSDIEGAMSWKGALERAQDPVNRIPVKIIETTSSWILTTQIKDPEHTLTLSPGYPVQLHNDYPPF